MEVKKILPMKNLNRNSGLEKMLIVNSSKSFSINSETSYLKMLNVNWEIHSTSEYAMIFQKETKVVYSRRLKLTANAQPINSDMDQFVLQCPHQIKLLLIALKVNILPTTGLVFQKNSVTNQTTMCQYGPDKWSEIKFMRKISMTDSLLNLSTTMNRTSLNAEVSSDMTQSTEKSILKNNALINSNTLLYTKDVPHTPQKKKSSSLTVPFMFNCKLESYKMNH
jgi:hypothetical protein